MKYLLKLTLFITLTTLPTHAQVDSSEQPVCQTDEISRSADHSEVILHDAQGRAFTDLRMLYRTWGCIPRTPKLDLKTLPNAKLACQSIGGRLPKLSEADSLARHVSENYILEKKGPNPSVLDSRFITEYRHFWTESLQKKNYVYRRALASLYSLQTSTDMSKAKVTWELTSEDAQEYRPYLCVFDNK